MNIDDAHYGSGDLSLSKNVWQQFVYVLRIIGAIIEIISILVMFNHIWMFTIVTTLTLKSLIYESHKYTNYYYAPLKNTTINIRTKV